MFPTWTRLARVTRHAAVAAASLLLLTSSAAYVFAPMGDAFAATVRTVASAPHHQSIEGTVQSKHRLHGLMVQITRREDGRTVVVATVKVGRNGHFDVPVQPGQYKVVIKDRHHSATETVKVTSGHSSFIVVKVVPRDGGFGIAPVIFNY